MSLSFFFRRGFNVHRWLNIGAMAAIITLAFTNTVIAQDNAPGPVPHWVPKRLGESGVGENSPIAGKTLS